MLQTFRFQGEDYLLFPDPVEVQVRPEAARNLSKIPASRFIAVVGYCKKNRDIVLFAKPGSKEPVDRLYVGHLLNPPEELAGQVD